MRSQQDYVLRTVEERGIRFVQLWFTDVLGTPKTFNITPAELENALEEGMTFDGSAIDGFSRVQESDVLPGPTPRPSSSSPGTADEAPVARVFCDIFNLDGTPVRGLPPPRPAPHPRPGPRAAASRSSPRPRSSTSTSPTSATRLEPPEAARHRARTSTSPPPTWPATCASAPCSPSRRWASPSSTPSTRTRPSQHEIDLRYTDALTMADTVMTVRLVVKETAQREGDPRQLHAQAPGRRAGLGHAHPPVAVRGRHNAFSDDGRPLRAVPGGQALHRRAAAPRPRDHGRHQPVGQLLQAPGPRLRGPGPRVLGPQQPLRARPGPGGQARQAGVDPDRVPGARHGLQPVPRLRRDPRGRAAREWRRATSCPARRPPTSSTSRPRSSPPRASAPLPGSLNEAVDEMERSELLARDPRRARLRVVHPQQAGGVGGLQDATSASSSSTATSQL